MLPRGLYGMVDLPSRHAPAALAAALLDGGAAVLQLRCKKNAPAAELLAALAQILPVARARGAIVIVNDRVDVALTGAADGVHLGQHDLPLVDARRLAPALIIGVSTHNLAQATAAQTADYIGFGPIFTTATKTNPDPIVGIDALGAACALGTPVVAIGGIGLDTIDQVVAAGAHAAAVIGAVNNAATLDAVRTAARAVSDAFARP